MVRRWTYLDINGDWVWIEMDWMGIQGVHVLG